MTKLIFEKSQNNTNGINLTTEYPAIENYIDRKYLSENEHTILPEISELEVMRHFKELSDKNFCIEKGFYPLGSCTMKYNPKVNELLASLDDFCNLHPLQEDDDSQGALKLMYNLQESLKEVTGMDAMTLQPAAGAHGELCGMMIVKKYFETIGENRKNVIIPDSAHGTNPASAAMCGFNIIEVKSNDKGLVDLEELKKVLDENTAAIMLTNPNTLGLFEENITEISRLVHEAGGLLYYDGANMNAIMGYTNPKLMGFDIVHINLHKTFSTPHGGGGPGAGPVGVVEKLKEFLPVPVIQYDGKKYFRNYGLAHTIGKMKTFYGNFSVMVRAYAYVLMMGKELKDASCNAVLNANYMMNKLKTYYKLPYDRTCMHEFVLSGDWQKEQGVNTLAIAKRLMDSNFHPPTVYFPLIVHEAIMIEPTESETKERLDDFINSMIEITNEIKANPEEVLKHPLNTPVKKVDETLAARKPDLAYKKQPEQKPATEAETHSTQTVEESSQPVCEQTEQAPAPEKTAPEVTIQDETAPQEEIKQQEEVTLSEETSYKEEVALPEATAPLEETIAQEETTFQEETHTEQKPTRSEKYSEIEARLTQAVKDLNCKPAREQAEQTPIPEETISQEEVTSSKETISDEQTTPPEETD